MKRILITGMSGTGKSTLIAQLANRGYKAVDLDSDEWSEWVPVIDATELVDSDSDPTTLWENQDWVWRQDRVQDLLDTEDTGVLFVSGTAPNQGHFRAQFDYVILLSARPAILLDRLTHRTTNSYGKHPYELARVLEQVQTVEPLLRRACTAEIDTAEPPEKVVEEILRIVDV